MPPINGLRNMGGNSAPLEKVTVKWGLEWPLPNRKQKFGGSSAPNKGADYWGAIVPPSKG